jgi:pimeloyl-ACP methyl ester carboxylesterase
MTGDPDWEQLLKTEAQVRLVAIGEHWLRVVEVGAALTVIAGAGHLVHQAPPEPFHEAVVRFLEAAS